MAIPVKYEFVVTNLPFSQLEKVLKALESKNVQEVPGTHSLYGESRCWAIDFDGARYMIEEFVEMVTCVKLVSAKPDFIKSLIDELESELSGVVNLRNYDKAKVVNSKIEQLNLICFCVSSV